MNRLSYTALSLGCSAALVWAAIAGGCVAGGGDNNVDDGGEDDGSGGSGATSGNTGGDGGGFVSVGGGGGSQPEVFEVYGHGPNELFRLDPTNNNLVTLVGPFTDCESGIIDIAIDKDNQILGVSSTALWSINSTNGSCTKIADGDFPNSLSFVPQGTLDANVEALVGYKEDEYQRIDPNTGNATVINATALVGGMESSGDVVSIDGGTEGNKTYLTVRGTAACQTFDCIVEVNPETGVVVENFGSVGYKDVFGLAFWGGSAYGFSIDGDVFQITFNGGSVSSQIITTAGLNVDAFWGAGSSTLVPLLPPQ